MPASAAPSSTPTRAFSYDLSFCSFIPSWVSSITNVIKLFLLYATGLEIVGKVAKRYKKMTEKRIGIKKKHYLCIIV